MSIDLPSALRGLAEHGAVHDAALSDDVLVDRIHHLVTRVRRRRAARHAATGVVGVGATAAIAVVGSHVPRWLEGAGVGAGITGAQADWAVPYSLCGTAVDDAIGTTSPVPDGYALSLDVAAPTLAVGDDLTATVHVTLPASPSGETALAGLDVVAAQDGVVVGLQGDYTDTGRTVDATRATTDTSTLTTPLLTCQGAPATGGGGGTTGPLEAGRYELYARQGVMVGDGFVAVRSAPVPVEIVP